MSNWGRETIWLAQIDQPLCTREYGDAFFSPTGGCTAVLGTTGTRKCFNTASTCQDTANYNPATLTLQFGMSQPGLDAYGYTIPSLKSVDIAPGSVNLGGLDDSRSALGEREEATLVFEDHRHSDLLVDKYRLERISGAASDVAYISETSGCARTPDSAAVSITGDIDLRIKAAADDWTPSAVQALIAKWFTFLGSNSRSFLWTLGTDGKLTLQVSRTGTSGTTTTFTSTAAPSVADGDTIYLRVTLDLDDGNSPGLATAKFYTSSDGSTWTQLGSDVTAAAISSIFDQTVALTVGGSQAGTGSYFAGSIFLAEIRNGIDGALAASLDADDGATGDATFTSSATGEQWTLIGDASLVNEGPYDPYTRGTFWGKFLARNPYYSNYALRIYSGYVGDDLSAMQVRNYIIDSIDGPSNGQMRVVAKDLLSKIEFDKAVAPTASRSGLTADISAADTSFAVTPTADVETDYPYLPGSPSELYVCIGEEIIKCTRSGANFTVLQRGALSTTAAAHNQEDVVQWVLVYTSQLAVDIVYDLLTNYTSLGVAGSPSNPYIDKASWDTAAAALTDLYTASIATPESIVDLIGELAQQAGFSVWQNIATGMIEFKALRAGTSSITLTDAGHIVAGSFSRQQKVEQRLSEVWVYYSQKDPTKNLDERDNFRSRFVDPDLTAEGDTQYGTPKIKEIFSRWIPQFGRSLAQGVSDRLLTMFRDPPSEITLRLHADQESSLAVAGYVTVATTDVQDETGAADSVQYAVLSVDRDEATNEISMRAQSVHFFDEATSATAERVIHIENDDFNLNLRTIHDLLYAAPAGGSPTLAVRFIVDDGVVVGSTSTSLPALTTGSWPAGVQVTLENRGTIQGKGGDGGGGGAVPDLNSAQAGSAGGDGGTALQATSTLILDNENGAIWGGGGGGGGGGGAGGTSGAFTSGASGGGGGGGAGTNGGNFGAAGGVNTQVQGFGASGSAGSSSAAGTGGSGAAVNNATSGAGGAGGGHGQAGSNGSAGSGSHSSGAAGAGGAAGKAIDGSSFVTQGSPSGDIQGTVV